MEMLFVGGPCAARELELTAGDLAAVPAEHQVPDVGQLVAGREGTALRFGGLVELSGVAAEARFVHVASADGAFTANLPLEEVRAHGLVLYGHAGGALPARLGGPFRLLLVDGDDCSVNVKFLSRVEFAVEEGSHTARCAD